VETVLVLVYPVIDDVQPAGESAKRGKGQSGVARCAWNGDSAREEKRSEDGEVLRPLPRTQRSDCRWRATTQGRPMPWYEKPRSRILAGSKMLRPSKTTGCLSSDFILSKSG
jgi:hypothetical protein